MGFTLLLRVKSSISSFLLKVQRIFGLYNNYNKASLLILFTPQEDISFISLVNPLLIIFMILILFIISYYLLYKKLDIPKSGSSFAFYSLNLLILLSYLFSFYILCTKDVKGYVSLEDLPVTTSYRYTLLFLLALIGIFLYLVSFYNARINDFLTLFKYPYLREELRKIMKGGFDGPLGTLCIKIIEYIFKYRIFKYAFFTIHFLFLYIYRLILALVFIWCCFFEGNFIYFLLLSPLSFIIWLLSCFNYYLTSFLQANTNYTKDILIVKMINEDLLQEDSRFIRTSLKDLSFQLSSFGKEEGFTEEDIASLRDSWAELVSVSATFSKYSFLQKNVSLFIFLLYLLCWAYISSLLVKESFSLDSTSTLLFGSIFGKFRLLEKINNIKGIVLTSISILLLFAIYFLFYYVLS
jgi:hypothetical protein